MGSLTEMSINSSVLVQACDGSILAFNSSTDVPRDTIGIPAHVVWRR